MTMINKSRRFLTIRCPWFWSSFPIEVAGAHNLVNFKIVRRKGIYDVVACENRGTGLENIGGSLPFLTSMKT